MRLSNDNVFVGKTECAVPQEGLNTKSEYPTANTTEEQPID